MHAHAATESKEEKKSPTTFFAAALKAAKNKNTTAQYEVGAMYESGRGVVQNDVKAAKWLSKAAKKGHVKAQCRLGLMRLAGRGVKQDSAKASKWFCRAIAQGDIAAQFELVRMAEKFRGATRNHVRATEWFQWYRKSAERGDAIIQNTLGWMYEEGCGVEKNNDEAAKWYRRTAENGCKTGKKNLLSLYFKCFFPLEHHYGVTFHTGVLLASTDSEIKKDFNQLAIKDPLSFHAFLKEESPEKMESILGLLSPSARKTITLAITAHKGDAVAQFEMGKWLLENNSGIPLIDDYQAATWFGLSAEQGNAAAQLYLGSMYEEGRGVSINSNTAAKWYRRSAEQGCPTARQNLLDLFLKSGFGSRSDIIFHAGVIFANSISKVAYAFNQLAIEDTDRFRAFLQTESPKKIESIMKSLNPKAQDTVEPGYRAAHETIKAIAKTGKPGVYSSTSSSSSTSRLFTSSSSTKVYRDAGDELPQKYSL